MSHTSVIIESPPGPAAEQSELGPYRSDIFRLLMIQILSDPIVIVLPSFLRFLVSRIKGT